MLREKAFRIGKIIKTHGVHGQLSVKTDRQISEPDEWPEWVFLDIDSGLVPFRSIPEDLIWRDERHFVLAVKDCDNQDIAVKLVGNDVWFPNEFKPLIERAESNAPPLLGFVMLNASGKEIGKIEDFIDLPENPLFQVMFEGKEILIPARAEWIIDVDEENGRIVMDLPDGLVDL